MVIPHFRASLNRISSLEDCKDGNDGLFEYLRRINNQYVQPCFNSIAECANDQVSVRALRKENMMIKNANFILFTHVWLYSHQNCHNLDQPVFVWEFENTAQGIVFPNLSSSGSLSFWTLRESSKDLNKHNREHCIVGGGDHLSRYLNLIRSYLHCRRERNDRKEKHNRKTRERVEVCYPVEKRWDISFFHWSSGIKRRRDFFRDKKKMKTVYPCFLWPRHQGEFWCWKKYKQKKI